MVLLAVLADAVMFEKHLQTYRAFAALLAAAVTHCCRPLQQQLWAVWGLAPCR
jgi:hypothetical protein